MEIWSQREKIVERKTTISKQEKIQKYRQTDERERQMCVVCRWTFTGTIFLSLQDV